MRQPVENFARDIAAADAAGRLDAPAFHRNREAILAVATELLGARSGNVLEIGSGTGQHASVLAAALPGLTFWPTDPVADHLASIDAWRADAGLSNLQPASRLDCLEENWRVAGENLENASLAAVLAINVIHIAPWRVAEAILSGAGRYLSPGGLLIFYGPYKRDGRHTAPSNAEFDAALRQRNPEYGIKDIADVVASAGSQGLRFEREIEMPANNLTLVFSRN